LFSIFCQYRIDQTTCRFIRHQKILPLLSRTCVPVKAMRRNIGSHRGLGRI